MPSTHTSSAARTWLWTLRQTWRTALQFDRTQITTVPAIRAAIGFALPLAIGVETGHAAAGVSVAAGALTLGTVGLTYAARARVRTMLLACAGVAISAFVGSITGRYDWLAILVAGLWGVGAGLLVMFGQPALVIGLQSTIALIILTHFMLPPVTALQQAGLMFAGAVFQTLLTLLPKLWRRSVPERVALVAVYRSLAEYADGSANKQREAAIRDALLKAYALIPQSDLHHQHNQRFLALLEQAEHIRLSVLIVRRLRQDVRADNVPAPLLQEAVEQLRAIAQQLAVPRSRIRRMQPHHPSKRRVPNGQLCAADALEPDAASAQNSDDILRAQLRRARRLAHTWNQRPRTRSLMLRRPTLPYSELHDALVLLRANLTLRSAVFRHAIRLGGALALVTALYRLAALPVQHGYWIPITTLLVLRSDFRTTFTRGVARLVGTIIGAVLATVLVNVIVPGNAVLVVADVLVAYLALSVLLANYALFSAFLTIETVILLSFVASQPQATALDRVIATIIGGLFALLVYLVWPTWEREQVWNNVATYLERLQHYVGAILNTYVDPRTSNPQARYQYRVESRLARSNLAASLERLLHEPATQHSDAELVQGVFAATEALVQSALTLDAYLDAFPTFPARATFAPLASNVDRAFGVVVKSAREAQSAASLLDIQTTLVKLQNNTKTDPNVESDTRVVLAETQRLLYSLSVIAQLVSTKRRLT